MKPPDLLTGISVRDSHDVITGKKTAALVRLYTKVFLQIKLKIAKLFNFIMLEIA